MEDVKKVLGFIMNNYVIKHATLIIAMLMLFYTWQHGRYNGNYINSDGKGYYAYLTAIFIYQDLDYNFVDDYEMKYYAPESYFHFKREIGEDVANVTFAGIAVLWLPFFLVAHLGSMIFGLPTDGYAPLYQWGVGIAALFYLLLALWGLKKLLEIYGVNKYHIILVQIILTFATPIYFYTTVDASFTHIYSFSLITLFFYYSKRYLMDNRAKHLYLVSLIFGLIVLSRPTNMIVVAALPFIAGSWPVLRDGILGLLKEYKQLIIAAVIFGAVVSIQPLLYYAQVGEFFIWTYTGVGFNFTDPHIFDVLFSYKKGLFLYTPILIFSLLGFFHLIRRNIYEAFCLFLYMFIFTYVISSWWSWWYGMSYGHRAFLDHYVVFGLLFGLALSDDSWKTWRYMIYIVTPVLIWFNMLQVYQFKNWILYWDMDEEKYWRIFLKTDDEYKGMLWSEAKQIEQEEKQRIMEDKFKDLVSENIFEDNFERDLPDVQESFIEKNISRSGNTSVRLTKKYPYSPGLKTKVRNLPDSTRMLIRASAWVYVPDIPKMNTFAIICSIENENGTYHYEGVDVNEDDLKIGEWNQIEIATENNKLRSPDDLLKVYVWYTGKREVFVDDIRVELY
jgi:hypothetical protein